MLNKIIFSLKYFITYTWSKAIYLEIFFYRNILKKNLYFFKYYGWADIFCFYLSKYSEILDKKEAFVFYWDQNTKNIVNFFFKKKKTIKSSFFIPKFISSYEINSRLLSRSENIGACESLEKNLGNDFLKKNSIEVKNFLVNLINSQYSHNLNFLKKKKYVCFYLRYHNDDVKIVRSSSDISKGFKLVNYLIGKGYDIVLMGNGNEKYLKIFIEKYKNEIKQKKIMISSEIIREDYLSDQLFVMLNSVFFCGTQSGFLAFYYFLKKYSISFDGYFRDEYLSESFDKQKFLYKHRKDVKIDLTEKHLDIKGILNLISENSFEEIKTLIEENYKFFK
jgi:hypothetical protein